MLKIAHYSDLHSSQAHKDESLKMLGFILDTCREREVDLIINSGDTFNETTSLGERGPVAELLGLITGCPIHHIIIEGTKSHDIPGSVEIFSQTGCPHIQVFRQPDSFPLYLPGRGPDPVCHISVLPAPSKSFFTELHKDLSPEDSNKAISEALRAIMAGFGAKAKEGVKPHIVAAHITVAGSETSTGQTLIGGEIQVSKEDLGLSSPDYVALGHIHKSQQRNLPFNFRYAGSPYHLNAGELEEKGFFIITFDDNGGLSDIEFVKTPCRPRQVIKAHIIEGDLVLADPPFPGADIEVRIEAPKNQLHDLLIQEAQNRCAEAASVKVKTIPTPEARTYIASFESAKNLADEFSEYCRDKGIEPPPGVSAKICQLEEASI